MKEKWDWNKLSSEEIKRSEVDKLRKTYEKNYKPANCIEKQLARYKKHMNK